MGKNTSSGRVRRQGLEPRTRGLRVRCPGVCQGSGWFWPGNMDWPGARRTLVNCNQNCNCSVPGRQHRPGPRRNALWLAAAGRRKARCHERETNSSPWSNCRRAPAVMATAQHQVRTAHPAHRLLAGSAGGHDQWVGQRPATAWRTADERTIGVQPWWLPCARRTKRRANDDR
jgi:hypothetical protein